MRLGAGRHLQAALDAVQTCVDPALVDVGTRQQHAGAHQLEVQARGGRAAHVGEALGDHLGRAGQLARTHAVGLRGEPLALVGGHVDQAGGEGVGHGGDDDEVAEAAQEVLGEAARVLADLDDLVDAREHAVGVAGGEGVHDLVEEAVGRVAQQPRGLLVADARLGRATEQLVEHRQRVTHRPGAGAHHQRQHGVVDRHALGGAQLGQVGGQRARRHQPERVVVRARADRADDLLGLGRGEDELHVGRRLLHHLQQGVEALRRDHVRLVDDVDLVAAVHGGEERPLAQVARLVDATVRGGVDLDHVDAARPAARQVAAALAGAARRRRGALLTVQAAGENARAGGLAAATRAAEQVGVVDAVVREGPLQRHGHVLLPDHLVEGVGAVAAVQGQRGVRTRGRGRRLGRGRRRGQPLGFGRRGLGDQRHGLVDASLGLGVRLVGLLRIDRDLVVLVEGEVHLGVVDRRRLGGQDQLVGFGAEEVGPVLLVGGQAVIDDVTLVVVEQATHHVLSHAPHPTGSPRQTAGPVWTTTGDVQGPPRT